MARSQTVNDSRKVSARPPISAHPAFPAIVALWFAALLGLGSMVLPVAVLERIVAATGLSAVLPSAAPPLGFTARILISLCATVAGALAGVVLARRIAASHLDAPAGRAGRRFAPEPRRPLNAEEDLKEVGLVEAPVKRRSLALTENERASDFLNAAPLPGEELHPAPLRPTKVELPEAVQMPAGTLELLEVAEDEAGTEPATADPADAAREEAGPSEEFQPVPEVESSLPDAVDVVPGPKGAGEAPLVFKAPSLARQQEEEATSQPFAEPDVAAPEPDGQGSALEPQEDRTVQGDWSEAPLDQLGLVQLVQRLGHSLEMHRALKAQVNIGTAAAMHLPPVAADLDAAPADEAAEAMAAYFGRQAPTAGGEPAFTPCADDEPFTGEEQATAATTGQERFAASLSRLSFHDEGEDDEDEDFHIASSFSLPLDRGVFGDALQGGSVVPQGYGVDEAAGYPDDEPEDEPLEELGFGSLVEMQNPFRQAESPFPRIEEPELSEEDGTLPSVVFPNQEEQREAAGYVPEDAGPADRNVTQIRPFDPPAGHRANQAETDEALRDALAKLQRMNGTA